MSFITNRSKLQQRPSPPEMRRDLFGDKTQSVADGSYPHGTGDFFSNASSPSFGASTSSAAPLLQPSPPFVPSSSADPLAGALLGVSDMVTRLAIIHPCTVIRRQCQVHQNARSLHVTPFTLVPVVFNMAGQHGVSTFWRGSLGCGVLWGMSAATELIVADLCGLPRSVVADGSSTKYWKHILLKAGTCLLMTPFYISSFIETIRSGRGLSGGEDNRALEVITKGFERMKYFFVGARDTSRKFSLLHLAVPTVCFHTSHYILQMFIQRWLFSMAKDYVNRKPQEEKTKLHEYIPEIFAQMTSSVLTDLALFPFETILHRLYVQGTRTLIDDMDTGVLAISMKVKYDGWLDCARQILKGEGVTALYAGAGAVLLQWVLQMLLQQAVRACFDKGSEALRRAAPATPPLAPPSSGSSLLHASPMSSPHRMPQPPSSGSFASSPPRAPGDYPAFGELSANDPLALFAQSSQKRLNPLYLNTGEPALSGSSFDKYLHRVE